MKQFGFPQIARGGDGGGEGGGGADGMDAYGMAEPTDMTLDTIDVIGGLGGPGGPGDPNGGFSSDYGVDSFSGPGSLDLTADNFSDPAGIGAHNFTGGFGYGLDGVPAGITSNFADRGAPFWGLASNPQPGFANRFGGINDTTHAIGAQSFASPPAWGPASSPPPPPPWASPFAEPSRGLPQQLFNDRFTGLPGKGLSPYNPGPSIAEIPVQQTVPGRYSQTPPGAAPTESRFGLPAANHPGARVGEIDWAAASQAGLDNFRHNTLGEVSAEGMAIRQAQNTIPFVHTSTDGYQSLMHPTRGSVAPELLAYEQQQNTPYQQTSTDGFTSWVHPQRGFIGEDDPEVQALMARMRGG
jgi:hypothetical protein